MNAVEYIFTPSGPRIPVLNRSESKCPTCHDRIPEGDPGVLVKDGLGGREFVCLWCADFDLPEINEIRQKMELEPISE